MVRCVAIRFWGKGRTPETLWNADLPGLYWIGEIQKLLRGVAQLVEQVVWGGEPPAGKRCYAPKSKSLEIPCKHRRNCIVNSAFPRLTVLKIDCKKRFDHRFDHLENWPAILYFGVSPNGMALGLGACRQFPAVSFLKRWKPLKTLTFSAVTLFKKTPTKCFDHRFDHLREIRGKI